MSNLLLLHAGGPIIPASGGTTSTLNPADKAANVTLSGGNLTATNTVGGTGNVRGTLLHNAGSWHYEATCNTAASGFPSYPLFGLANNAASLTADLGNDTNSFEVDRTGGFFFNAASLGATDPYGPGDIVAVEVNLGTFQAWVQKLGGSGRLGPFSFAAMGAASFIAFGTKGTTGSMTLNTGGSAFQLPVTGGFSAWG